MMRISSIFLNASRRMRDIALLDRVYEHVSLPPVIVAAIDTPYVQRLRGLKQLGASSYLYPGAVHTRFEHSIGVAHLARHFLMTIAAKQPELNITQRDVEIAMMAGLTHDVGHGPFSHLFEDVITKRSGVKFVHEDMSEKITEKMLRNDLKLDEEFISATLALVSGGIGKKSKEVEKNTSTPSIASTIPYWELISNKRNGIDVDRLDYLFRDSLCCFGKPTIDVRVNRLFNAARIVKVPNGYDESYCDPKNNNAASSPGAAEVVSRKDLDYRLVFEGKMAVNIRELFGLRAKLHKSVYQHHVVKAVGHMIGDCLAAAAPYFRVNGKTLIECAETVEDFTLLGDWVLDAVAGDPNPHLAEAKQILNRLRTRDLYALSGSVNIHLTTNPTQPSSSSNQSLTAAHLSESLILQMLTDTASKMGLIAAGKWDPTQIVVDVVVINHGKGKTDPLAFVDFFNPKNDSVMALGNDKGNHQQQVSIADSTPLFRLAGSSPLLSPSAFEERTILVFSKHREMTSTVRHVFNQWRNSADVRDLLFEGLSFHNPRV